MAASPKIIELRQLVADRLARGSHQGQRGLSPRASADSGSPSGVLTGLACLDAVGLPKGAVSELVCPHPSGGSATLLAGLIRATTHAGTFVALVDGADSFDPQGIDAAACRRLLWVRCRDATEAVKATDLLLRDGNLPFIVLDLRVNSDRERRRIGNPAWYRFQSLVHRTSAVFLALTPQPMISSARLRLQMDQPLTLDDLQRTPDELLARLSLRVLRRRIQPETDWTTQAMPEAASTHL